MPEPPPDILIRALEPSDLPDLTEAWNQPRAYAGTLQLRLGIHLGPHGWVADELTD